MPPTKRLSVVQLENFQLLMEITCLPRCTCRWLSFIFLKVISFTLSQPVCYKHHRSFTFFVAFMMCPASTLKSISLQFRITSQIFSEVTSLYSLSILEKKRKKKSGYQLNLQLKSKAGNLLTAKTTEQFRSLSGLEKRRPKCGCSHSTGIY